MADKVVPLSRSYGVHGVTFDKVTLRSPTLADHFAVGDPVEIHPAPDGTGQFVVQHLDRIADYRDRLVREPGLEMLMGLDLVDSLAIKDAITDFFLEAHRLRAKPTS